jgi:glucose-6-phosphate 1-epimerase
MIEELAARFGIADVVRFEAGPGRLVRAVVTTASAVGHVYLHGAHVTHYVPAGEQPLLFTSPRSQFVAGKAIRGGVPVIFPWFGPRADDPTAPEHGFARVAEWAVDSVRTDDGSVAVTLRLDPSEATRATWPHEFRLRHEVVFGPRLTMTLEVENRGRDAFSFEEALHTYLLVGDVRRATIAGLEGTSYIDKTDGMKRKRVGDEPLQLVGPTDRVFPGTRTPCVVDDPVLGRRLVVEKEGSATTVVWNPWSEKAAAMADLGADAWPSMLCVETANTGDDAVSLAPGERHRMTAVVSSRSQRKPARPQ